MFDSASSVPEPAARTSLHWGRRPGRPFSSPSREYSAAAPENQHHQHHHQPHHCQYQHYREKVKVNSSEKGFACISFWTVSFAILCSKQSLLLFFYSMCIRRWEFYKKNSFYKWLYLYQMSQENCETSWRIMGGQLHKYKRNSDN